MIESTEKLDDTPDAKPEKTTIHIRQHKANNPNCLTLCGIRVHSVELAQDRPTFKYSEGYKTSSHSFVVHSVTMGEAQKLDGCNPSHVYLPCVMPSSPPLRLWDFCLDCWEHPVRAIKKLKDITL